MFLHFSFFFLFVFLLFSHFSISPSLGALPVPLPEHLFVLHFLFLGMILCERRKKKKKEERADRNRSLSTIARTGPFRYSRAWKPLTPTKQLFDQVR